MGAKIFETKKYEKYLPIIFFVIWFILFLVLSYFRDAKSDENIYLGDSAVIADLLNGGKWIGNYGVGLHGFITKLLVGIIFIFTGPSVFIATLFNIFLGISSGVLFYHILKKHFSLSLFYSLIGTTLFFSSFQLVTYLPTFYRETSVLLAILLVIDCILSKRNDWITGLFLVFVLDGKEHVFYTLAPALILWMLVVSWGELKTKKLVEVIKEFVSRGFKIFLPSLLFIILMLTTSIIPLNIYNPNILGLTDEGTKQFSINFDPQFATINRDSVTNPEIARYIKMIPTKESYSQVVKTGIEIVNIILSYIGKIGYPRTFSFLSIPFLILIPAVITAIQYIKKWFKEMDKEKLFLPIAMFVYLIIYIAHASISRYILPISPIIYIFFLLALDDISKRKKMHYASLILIALFVSWGLFFEYSYVLIKIIFSFIIFLSLFVLGRIQVKRREVLKYLLVFCLSAFIFLSSLLASYKNGQIGASILYGYDRECEKILKPVKEETIWINDIGWDRLPYVLRNENVQNPEWRWGLKDWLPKNNLLFVNKDFRTYSFSWKSEESFKERVYGYKISKVLYVQLAQVYEGDDLLMQNKAEQISKFNWLELEKTTEMKNKTVYIYNVVY